MSSHRSRGVVAALAAGGLLAAAAPALAEPGISGSPSSAVVTTSIGQASSRQLALLDLAGAPLVNLALRPGVPAPFRVQVTDTGVNQLTEASSGFTVNSTLNNLYLGGNSSAAFIPSGDVTVSFPASGAQNAVGSLVALPRTVLSGDLPACNDLLSTITELAGLSLLSGAGLQLCNAVGGLGGTGLTVPEIELLTSTEQTLSSLTDVPFTLGGQESGPYTLADYVNGIGAQSGGAAGTPRKLLTGAPNISAGLQTQLDALATAVQNQAAVVSPDGSGAQLALGDVIGTLLTTTGMEALGNALAGLTPTQASAVLNQLDAVVEPLGLGDITSVAGLYNSFPVLTADPTTDPAQGEYSGTLTVTLVQP